MIRLTKNTVIHLYRFDSPLGLILAIPLALGCGESKTPSESSEPVAVNVSADITERPSAGKGPEDASSPQPSSKDASSPSSNPCSKAQEAIGGETTLTLCQLEKARYDESPGIARVRLWGICDRTKIHESKLEGTWNVKGFNHSTGAYTLFGIFQDGGAMRYNKVAYLDEASMELRSSRYGDSEEIQLNAAVPSPNGRWIAIIGSAPKWGLHVLDTTKDKIIRIGEEPAPPPEPDCCWKPSRSGRLGPDGGVDALVAELEAENGEYSWSWGCALFNVMEMDDDIISFQGDTLLVSYGADTVLKRAEKRKVKKMKLPTAGVE